MAAVCLRSKEIRLAEGSFDASDQVELFAAVVDFALVAVQAVGIAYAYRHERAKNTSTGTEQQEERAAGEAGMCSYSWCARGDMRRPCPQPARQPTQSQPPRQTAPPAR